MDGVVHFEMPYDNRDRMAKFFQSAFGWQMQMLGKDMGNYVVATTTETGDQGPKKPGAINGGLLREGAGSAAAVPVGRGRGGRRGSVGRDRRAAVGSLGG